MPISRTTRTPLMAMLRRCFRRSAAEASIPELRNNPLYQKFPTVGGKRFTGPDFLESRRDFVKGALALGAVSFIPGCRESGKHGPRVAIVGAGIAGLAAAHTLSKGGINADIYEAGARTGGRILTLKNLVAPGTHTEAGGEFIDSSHVDMLSLAREMGLNIKDALGPEFAGLIPAAFHFGGRLRSEAEVTRAVKEMTAGIQADIDSLPEDISAGTSGRAAELDRIPLDAYLAARGVTGWLRDLLIAAYVAEFGLDAGSQSCLNLLTLISLDVSKGRLEIYGESDERFRVEGGNQGITDALARGYAAQLRLGHRLEAVTSDGDGYKLAFQGAGGAVEKKADAVILALPFTLLRKVAFRPELPAAKRKAIDELGYGTNSKLFLGFSSRPWRAAGHSGDFFTDGPMQSGWDHTKVQQGESGGLTVFQGGKAGMDMGDRGPAASAAAFSDSLEAMFPGCRAARNGNLGAFHWPTHPLSLGSYACYKPGQWTTLAGEEAKPVGGLYFAGEHCSAEFQGYMNGGAATGREAAEAVLTRMSAAKKS